jgi:hypothetical protein
MKSFITHDGDKFKLIAENYTDYKQMIQDNLYCKDLHEPSTQKGFLSEKLTKIDRPIIRDSSYNSKIYRSMFVRGWI